MLVFTAHPAPKCRKHRWGPGFLRLAVRLGFYGASWPQVPKTPAWPMFSAHAVSTVFYGTSSIFGVNPVARCTKRRPHRCFRHTSAGCAVKTNTNGMSVVARSSRVSRPAPRMCCKNQYKRYVGLRTSTVQSPKCAVRTNTSGISVVDIR